VTPRDPAPPLRGGAGRGRNGPMKANGATQPDPFFFGYGSLVNRATHVYAPAHRARLRGWRRTWRHTALRDGPFLTAIPCPDSEIEGLIAPVPGADWVALDAREAGYDRHPVGPGLTVETVMGVATQIYAVPEAPMAADGGPILLSYLDVVLQGYLLEFGHAGVRRFMDTTDGWETPVLDDRAAPRYPRHQRLGATEHAMVDAELDRLGVKVLR
jgi:hypothetical protein